MDKLEAMISLKSSSGPKTRIRTPDFADFNSFINRVKSMFRDLITNYDIMNVLCKVSNTEMEGKNYKITLNDGTICRYSKDKVLHCANGYAVIKPDGSKYSLINGKLHSLAYDADGKNVLPSVIHNTTNGNCIMYHRNGLIHSFNDAPAIITNDTNKFWFREGLVHRDCDEPVSYDSPNAAIEHNGFNAWFVNGVMIAGFSKPTTLNTLNTPKTYTEEEVNELVKVALAKQKEELLKLVTNLC